jgi:hypothetical protein
VTHPADADYSAHHSLSDDAIDDMLDAAIDTANAISASRSGRRWRRLSRPIEGGREFGVQLASGQWVQAIEPAQGPPPKDESQYVSDAPFVTDWFDFGQASMTRIPVGDPREARSWEAGTYEVAKEQQMATPITLPASDVALIRDLVAVTEARIERLRETTASTHPVIDKALTSMSLGLLGLVKVVGDDEHPASE